MVRGKTRARLVVTLYKRGTGPSLPKAESGGQRYESGVKSRHSACRAWEAVARRRLTAEKV